MKLLTIIANEGGEGRWNVINDGKETGEVTRRSVERERVSEREKIGERERE